MAVTAGLSGGSGFSDDRQQGRKSRQPEPRKGRMKFNQFEKDSVAPIGGRAPSILPQGRQKTGGESAKQPTPMNTRELLLVSGRVIGALPETAEAVKKALKHGVAVSPPVLERLKEAPNKALGELMAPEPPVRVSGARALGQIRAADPDRRKPEELSQSEPIMGELAPADMRTVQDIAWVCGTICAEVRHLSAPQLKRLGELGVTKERVGLMNQLAGMMGPSGIRDYQDALRIIRELGVKGRGLQTKFDILDRLRNSLVEGEPIRESPFGS